MNYFIGALKKYAVFEGRARRSEYWYFVLFGVIFYVVIGVISSLIDTNILSLLFSIAIFIPSLAVSVRRLHDIGRSGWMILINFIPIAGFIWYTVLMCLDSNIGQNEYGPNPKMPVSISSIVPPQPNIPMSS
ncbi:hypothetical protein COW81_00600 [Candidatus Campbellbacteria bacterium CG22_combo_CG10-13_8_21_14_all_36_13]|uniref:DUF805 domain-containing protein n=1 Tax=Candidatus Campbellbacteria bacterium CG22_combo_CG10-13_8_21_14_all_36_13 TaxID=1974529 RepID=A0A2H0DYV9_9BACT|nr:MAG: hypothetical protein COW81_00600 [Candidatus Campbellbacteria bacterium CG22_combo_CG10-13_8_21_14_all_36_13]